MFTGIIEETGVVHEGRPIHGGRGDTMSASFGGAVHMDESIAVNGVWLTVVSFNENHFKVQSVEETLRKTTTGNLKRGDKVNLERSLTLEKAIEGHILQGHVDTVGTIKKIDQSDRKSVVEGKSQEGKGGHR